MICAINVASSLSDGVAVLLLLEVLVACIDSTWQRAQMCLLA
jgi:hypothetical protein